MDKRNPIESRKETNLLKAIEDREEIIRLSSITINQLETKQSLLKTENKKSIDEIADLNEQLKEMRLKNEILCKENAEKTMKISELMQNKDDEVATYRFKIQEYTKEILKLNMQNNLLKTLQISQQRKEF